MQKETDAVHKVQATDYPTSWEYPSADRCGPPFSPDTLTQLRFGSARSPESRKPTDQRRDLDFSLKETERKNGKFGEIGNRKNS